MLGLVIERYGAIFVAWYRFPYLGYKNNKIIVLLSNKDQNYVPKESKNTSCWYLLDMICPYIADIVASMNTYRKEWSI